MKNLLIKILSWLIVILIPFVLIMSAVRILITPLFPKVEYQMPGFPEDQYGFTNAERLQYAIPSIQYLVNREPIAFLEALKFENGTPIYNERELSHMVDVKVLVQLMIKLWLVALSVILGSILLFEKWNTRQELRKSLQRGGGAAIGLIVAMLLLVVLNFNELFNWFHYAFFTGDTWLFLENDTLIRLFPLRFWQDAFIFVGGFVFLGGILLIFLSKDKTKK